MPLEMVFNELSIETQAINFHEARNWMEGFVGTIRSAAISGVNRVIRTHIDMNSTLLAPDYPMSKWRNDENVDLETRRYFRSIISQHPALEDRPDIIDSMNAHDFFYKETRVFGLGMTYLLDYLSISLPSMEDWNNHKLKIEIQLIEEENEGDLITNEISIKHASDPSHLDELGKWISERLQNNVENANDLWNRRAELFPHLFFCGNTETQILSLHHRDPLFQQVLKRLFELEKYCSTWQEGAFSADGLPFKATPESASTMQKYGDERTFNCPNGNKVTFNWHGRLTPNNWRIFFDPTIGPGQMSVGYIGTKLSTVNYKV
jgi:hypothetical protein